MKKKSWAMVMMFFVLAPLHILARRGDPPPAPVVKKEKPQVLAVVAIPAYVDTTGSKNYGYLSGSLTDAVNNSMQQKFDYARANQSAVDAQTQKAWVNRVPSDEEIRRVATATASDYVVVGSYSLSKNKKQIIFNTRIFIAPDKFIDAPTFTNNADATLFDATNKVAEEIVKTIEADALARAAAAPQKDKPIKEGEKITLAKTPEPEPPSEPTQRYSDRYLRAGVGYATNTVERHTQFYNYASSPVTADLDFRLSDYILLYGKATFPQTPSGGAIPATYQNKGNQTLGLEIGDRFGNYVVGFSFRNFTDTNPGATTVRDLLGWSMSGYLRTHFDLFELASIHFGIDLDSYLDYYSTKVTNLTNDKGKFLLNFEGALNVSYFIPVINTSLTGIVGGAYSLLDTTNQVLIASGTNYAWDTSNRNTVFTGVRYGLELAKWFGNVSIKGEVYTTPSVHSKYQPFNAQGSKVGSYTFALLSAHYRFGF